MDRDNYLSYKTIENPTSKDLSDIANLNGNGFVNFDGIPPNASIYPNQEGVGFLKGALSPARLHGDVYTNHERRLDTSMYDDNFEDGGFKLFWFWLQFEKLFSAACELVEYKNLPFSKYILEYPLRYNGIVGIIKIKNGAWKVLNVTIPQEDIDYNFAELPKYVQVAERDSNYDMLKNIKFEVNKNIVVVRNNLFQNNDYIQCRRYLWDLEKILFYFEKNNAVSLPKAMMISDLNKSDKLTEQWRNFVKGSQTLDFMWVNSDLLNVLRSNGFRNPWIPMQFEDKTRQLVENFNFIFERLKELFGFDTMNLNGKKERVTTQEVNVSNSMASYNLKHLINIRNEDLKAMKQVFNLDVTCTKSNIDNPLLEKKAIDDEKGKRDAI